MSVIRCARAHGGRADVGDDEQVRRLSSGWSAGSGSGSVTSSAAPAIAPLVQRALERGLVDDRRRARC